MPLPAAPTLRQTLLWGGLGFAAVALAGSMTAIHVTGMRRAELERSTEAVFQEEQIANRIVAAVNRQVLDAMFYLRDPRPETLEAFRRESGAAYDNLTLYLFRDLTLPERIQVETMKERHQLVEVTAQTAFDLAAQGRAADAEVRVQLLQARVADLQSSVFRAATGQELTYGAVLAYDAVALVAEGLRRGARNRDELQRFLAHLRRPGFPGVGGAVFFDGRGDADRPYLLAEVLADSVRAIQPR